MRQQIIKLLEKTESFHLAAQRLNRPGAQVQGGAVPTGAWGLVVEAFRAMTGRPLIVIASGEADAHLLMGQLSSEAEGLRAVHLQARDRVFFKSIAHSGHLDQARMQTLHTMLGGCDVVVASAESFLDRLPDPEVFKAASQTLRLGDRLPLEPLLKQLVKWGYERVELVEGPGQFSVRGDIFDIFLPVYDEPIRFELFDDEIDSIRSFTIEDQRSQDRLEEAVLCPAGEIFLSDEQLTRLMAAFRQEEIELGRKKGMEEALSWCRQLQDGLSADPTFDDLRKYTGYLPEFNHTFLSYCSPEAVVVYLDWQRTWEKVRFEYQEFLDRYQLFLEKGEGLPGQYRMILTPEEVQLKTQAFRALALLRGGDRPDSSADYRLLTLAEAPSYYGKLEDLASDIRKWQVRGYKLILATGGADRTSRLYAELQQEGLSVQIAGQEADPVVTGQCLIASNSLTAGFRCEEARLIVLSEQELFGIQKKARRPRKGSGRLIQSFNELQVGDLVVHEHHGVGKYLGVEQLKVEGLRKDYLKVQYQGEDFLYIPIEQMELIQKYIGSEGGAAKLNRLGGGDWSRTKARAKKAIEDMTDELLQLYAQRNQIPGYAYSADTPWQRQLEDGFQYEETPDQLRCIDEIKGDMEKPECMDRLLCGDVGFGKTEVALRAVFKAVMEGKQAAFLVPTTILAQQHFNTMAERFAHYPVHVEMLSRFRSKKEQEAILKNLEAGVVDVVVGTHRLLSKDVLYKDLGLLVVDEEQRFGVRHKEAIKTLKKNVDVLTLTATPIPRTLHMSLIGVRDMSIIEDPPEDRYPIQTYVVEEDPLMIREAILKEVERGGQVYFVHNRIEDIDRVTGALAQRMPQVRFHFAHGQMNEHQLERIMKAFYHHEIDVLVCTTIIETGLDISNVNTIIINDADQMGLSQLYQLRGRVGRSNRLAYAYLIYPRNKVLSEVAEKRLRAVKELVELGSGFKIAMKDLEIRGAGNLLGASQSGHMAAIGYDLYCKMLEETVKGLKGMPVAPTIETTVELTAAAYVPEGYIPDDRQKMEIYKKIAAIHNRKDLYRVQEELEDRFGTIPDPVETLMRIAHIKALAQQISIQSLTEDSQRVQLLFHPTAKISPLMVVEGMARYEKSLSFNGGNPPFFAIRKPRNHTRDALLKHIESVLEHLGSFQTPEN